MKNMMLHVSHLYVWILDLYRGAPGIEGRQSGLATGENSGIVPCVLPWYLSLRFSLHAPRLPGQHCGDHQWRPVPLRPRGHAQWDVRCVSGREQGGRFMAVSILRPDAPLRLRLYCTNETMLTFRLPFHSRKRASNRGKTRFTMFFFFFPFYLVLLFFKKYGQWHLLC